MTGKPQDMDMNRIAALGDLEQLEGLVSVVESKAAVDMVRKPQAAMVMVRHVDPLEKTAYYMGEALVTECEVRTDSRLGYACVMGHEERRAYIGSVLDSLAGENDKGGHSVLAEIMPLLAALESGIREEHERESACVNRTRVSFDLKERQ